MAKRLGIRALLFFAIVLVVRELTILAMKLSHQPITISTPVTIVGDDVCRCGTACDTRPGHGCGARRCAPRDTKKLLDVAPGPHVP